MPQDVGFGRGGELPGAMTVPFLQTRNQVLGPPARDVALSVAFLQNKPSPNRRHKVHVIPSARSVGPRGRSANPGWL